VTNVSRRPSVRSAAGHYALLPLMHEPAEWALTRLLQLAHFCATLAVLRGRLHAPTVGLRSWEFAYLAGFVPLDALCSFVHPLFLAPRMPFMPLMATSVYCAFGIVHATGLSYRLWTEYLSDRFDPVASALEPATEKVAVG